MMRWDRLLSVLKPYLQHGFLVPRESNLDRGPAVVQNDYVPTSRHRVGVGHRAQAQCRRRCVMSAKILRRVTLSRFPQQSVNSRGRLNRTIAIGAQAPYPALLLADTGHASYDGR